ncbi:DsbA family protein [Tsukamurella paurometabola]|nr:thioredoxin domain-containing protein [Tsukamurella paurometabola]UEA85016.1 DsbA family protein [Tsukamurella paurometabola]
MKTNRGVIAVVLAVVAVLALTGCSRSITGSAVADPGAARPVASEGAITVGSGGREMTVYVDFLCPACALLERENGAAISSAVAAGRLTVVYRPMAFLDRMSASGTYSSRALAAFAATAKASSSATTQRFVAALFDAQPREGGTDDLSNAGIADIAAKAGVAAATVAKIREGRTGVDAAAIDKANGTSLAAIGSTGTPTVVHDGRRVDLGDRAWLQKIVG